MGLVASGLEVKSSKCSMSYRRRLKRDPARDTRVRARGLVGVGERELGFTAVVC